MTDKYNKLVRDRIPEIIKQRGDIPTVEILGAADYYASLNKKLQEELDEYLQDYSVEELADIVEVIYAIVRYKGISISDFEQIRLDKNAKRGCFDKRIALIKVERKPT